MILTHKLCEQRDLKVFTKVIAVNEQTATVANERLRCGGDGDGMNEETRKLFKCRSNRKWQHEGNGKESLAICKEYNKCVQVAT